MKSEIYSLTKKFIENSFIQIIKTGSELGSFIIIYLVYYFYDRPIEKKLFIYF